MQLHKKKTIPYLEIAINMLMLLIFCAFSVLTPKMGKKEILSVTLIISIFYIHTFFIIPVLVAQKKKLRYAVLIIALSVTFYLLIRKIIRTLFDDVQTGEDVFYIIFTLTAVLLLTLCLSFVYAYLRTIKAKERLFNLRLGSKESELRLLKSQVNPHFLFNSLNAIYATALVENAPKTSESIAKLASLIRYMQKDMNENFIPLKNEIKYIEDYVAIQKIRSAVEPIVELRFENIENYIISPGLLIPFVENAFKYGIDPSKPSKLEISVSCGNNWIIFECINTYHEGYKTYKKEEGFGIGIRNTKQRLELAYRKNHTFEIKKLNGVFSVKMGINTAQK
ncbi:sensor histidine kinase [Pedobacter duraquae]|uniref:Histidine kinase n=1 Tax=Pedobacter duraquae TaxID=425511 RepID=A0A4R6ILA9_9SPHI|nr:sensor histidine kinase [Pedobacter duraquae]TDO22736.1 histidine kinase [Pedobacter duraquae]